VYPAGFPSVTQSFMDLAVSLLRGSSLTGRGKGKSKKLWML